MKEWDKKKEARGTIRHFVIGGMPPESAIEQYGGQTELYADVLKTIQGWSGLTLEEIEEAIKASPDVIENTTDHPNFKPLYLEAVKKLRE